MTRIEAACVAIGALFSSALAGCSPKIGDHCILNTDCGASGQLICDTAQRNGYCTQFNCTADVCQNKAACVGFLSSVPGCPYDDYQAPSRTQRNFCMAQCQSDSDCRQSEGYSCQDPRGSPWFAAIIDDDQSQKVCIAMFSPSSGGGDSGGGPLPEGSVSLCSPTGPSSVPSIDATSNLEDAWTLPDAVVEVGVESAAADGAPDAGSGDAASDAADGSGVDGALDDVADAGAADASEGG